MAGKKTTDKEGSSWIGEVEKYSRKIWLAGLGVYSKVSSDGGKYFETLVKDGEKAEKLTKSTVGKQVDAAKASAGSAKAEAPKAKPMAPKNDKAGRGDSSELPFSGRVAAAAE